MKTTSSHCHRNLASAIPASGSRLSQILLLSTAVLAVSASAAVTNINGNLSQGLDTVVGEGNSALLTGDTTVLDYDSAAPGGNGTYVSDVDLNGFRLTIGTGGGNGHAYTGAITGPGTLRLDGRSGADWPLPRDINLSGTASNSPTRVHIIKGRVNMTKTAGVDALAGAIRVSPANTQVARLIWHADDQINDLAEINSTSSGDTGSVILEIGSFTDTIKFLSLKAGHTIETSTGGALTVSYLFVNGSPLEPGTYTSADSFVTGEGSVIVTGAAPSVKDIGGNLGGGLDDVVGYNNSGRLIANTKVKDYDDWVPNGNGTYGSSIDLNGFELHFNTGGGNGHIYTGALTGPGTLRFQGRSSAEWAPPRDMGLAGTAANTPTSSLFIHGRLNLNKTPGVDALAGPITATVPDGNTARLVWLANHQINDASTIDSTSSVGTGKFIVQIDSYTDTIASMALKSGHTVETLSGGVLTVGYLTIDGNTVWPGTYTAGSGFVTGAGSLVVTGSPVDLAGDLTADLNTLVGDGNDAHLTGDAKTWYDGGTFEMPIHLHGFELHIDNGGGNAQYYNGKISGPGTLRYTGSHNAGYAPPEASLGGGSSNTIDGAVLVQGRLQLNKTPGQDALTGAISVEVPDERVMRLEWMANDQINDTATIDSTGGPGLFVIELKDFTDTIKGLTIKAGDSIETGTSGQLTVSSLIVDGQPLAAGTYTSADGFITGDGSVVVTMVADSENSTVTVSPESIIADGTTTATVTVTLLNEAGLPVSNKTVSLVSNRGATDTISAASGVSDASGVVTFTVKSATEGEATFTASIIAEDFVVTQTATLTFLTNPYAYVSNSLTPFDTNKPDDGVRFDQAIPEGKIGLLVGYSMVHYASSNHFNRTVDLNGYRLFLNNGGGNSMIINGSIIGNGEVEFRGGGVQILNMRGSLSNTYTGASFVTRGPVRLEKTAGNVISGSTVLVNENVALHANFAHTGTLLWGASNQVNDESNFTLQQGSFQLDGFAETVGTAALTGDFTIKLGVATTSQLHFADSSAVAWTAGKVLTITEWDGNYAGGGAEGIFFGNSAAGLTSGQLAQISFVNPTGIDPGTYGAKILSTGEVVPNTAPPGYEGWAENYANGQTADLDFDGDGVPNGVEYFMGETGSTFTATPGIDEYGAVLWMKDPSFIGTYEVQISYDLAEWVAAPEEALFHFADGVELDTTVLTPVGGKLFVRLLVSPGAGE